MAKNSLSKGYYIRKCQSDIMMMMKMRMLFSIKAVLSRNGVVDRQTQLICIGIFICQPTSTKDIAGQSANAEPHFNADQNCQQS